MYRLADISSGLDRKASKRAWRLRREELRARGQSEAVATALLFAVLVVLVGLAQATDGEDVVAGRRLGVPATHGRLETAPEPFRKLGLIVVVATSTSAPAPAAPARRRRACRRARRRRRRRLSPPPPPRLSPPPPLPRLSPRPLLCMLNCRARPCCILETLLGSPLHLTDGFFNSKPRRCTC